MTAKPEKEKAAQLQASPSAACIITSSLQAAPSSEDLDIENVTVILVILHSAWGLRGWDQLNGSHSVLQPPGCLGHLPSAAQLPPSCRPHGQLGGQTPVFS